MFDTQLIKEQVDLLALIRLDEPGLRQQGQKWVSGHQSQHSSEQGNCLSVAPEQGLWHCFHCGQGGDAIQWRIEQSGDDFAAACRWLCQQFNLPIPDLTAAQVQALHLQRSQQQRIRPILLQACRFYHSQLTAEHRHCLQQRSLKPETVEELLIGYAPPGGSALWRHLQDQYPVKDLLASGLFLPTQHRNYDHYQDRLIFPFWWQGEIVYSIGRLPDDQPAAVERRHQTDRGKYKKQLSHSQQRDYVCPDAVQHIIYGRDTVRGQKELLITEGIIDAILAIQAGYACLSPTSTRFSQNQLRQLDQLTSQAETVYLVNDNEVSASGLQGALTTAEALFNTKRQIRLVELPRPPEVDKMDLADYLQQQPDGLPALLLQSTDYLQFQIQQLVSLSQEQREKSLQALGLQMVQLPTYRQEPLIRALADNDIIRVRACKTMLRQLKAEWQRRLRQEKLESFRQKSSPAQFLRYQIDQLRLNPEKQPLFQIKKGVAQLIVENMKQIGQFHYTAEQNFYWFDQETNQLYLLDLHDQALQIMINHRYGLNASEMEYNYLLVDLVTVAQIEGQKTDIHRFAYYHSENGLYIYNHNNQIYKLDGQNVELVANGTDGVLFLDKPTHQTFTYQAGAGTGYVDRLLVDNINFDPDGSSLDTYEQRLIFKVWLKSLFFNSIQPTKPIQCFIGEKGSGKTTYQRLVGRFLFGPFFDVDTLEAKKEDAFIATITNNTYCAFDNADSPINWLPDRLAQVATGQRITLREYYTTNQEVAFFPQCFISINSRTPNFKRDDVMDRLLPFKVKRLEQFIPQQQISQQLMDNRDLLWSEMIDDLNQLVAYMQSQNTVFRSQFRMADFAQFGWQAIRADYQLASEQQEMGDYWLQLLGKLDQAQDEELLSDNPIALALSIWLEQPSNQGQELKSAELYNQLVQVAEEHRIGLPYKSSRSFGRAMRNIVTNLATYFQVQQRKVNNTFCYTFHPLPTTQD